MTAQTEVSADSATRDMADFVSRLGFDDIPEEVRAHAKLCLLDTLGCGLFSTKLPWCQIVNRYVTGRALNPTSVVWGTGLRVSAEDAALANATAVHGFELDEIHPSGVHPGTVAWTTALALADELGSSGQDVLTAAVAGYEAGTRVALSVQKAHLKAGFHAMGTIGSFIAAATAANVMKLDEEQTRNTLGIVGSFASGLIAVQEGAMTKRLHAGRAAQNGVVAARLAREGFTGIADVLENPLGGFCKTTGGGEEDLTVLTAGLGTVWETLTTGFKIHASCGATHSALDVTQQLRREHCFNADDVEWMDVHSSTHAVLHSGWAYKPDGGVTAAQMNYFFVLAVMLRYGEVSLDALTDEGVVDPETLEVASRIRVIADPEVDKLGRPGRYRTRVIVKLRDGRVVEGSARQRKGSKALPVSDREVYAKFRRLASTVLPESTVDEVQQAALGLDGLASASRLTELLVTS